MIHEEWKNVAKLETFGSDPPIWKIFFRHEKAAKGGGNLGKFEQAKVEVFFSFPTYIKIIPA